MNEEIDIVELLTRVKEGKAPKKIEIDDTIYYFINREDISTMYKDANSYNWLTEEFVTTKTKITILDKPIIEEIEPVIEELDEIELKSCNDGTYIKILIRNNRDKINEIIKHINEEAK